MVEPTVKSVTPNTGKTTSATTVIIKGTEYNKSSKVKHAKNVKCKSPTELQATYPQGMKARKYDVEVINGKEKGKLPDGFEVKAPSPKTIITAGGQIYLEWESNHYYQPAKFHIYRNGVIVGNANNAENQTTTSKEYYVDIQTKNKNPNPYKYKIECENIGGVKGESNETPGITLDVFKIPQDKTLGFFVKNEYTDIGKIQLEPTFSIIRFSSGKLINWSLVEAYMCKESNHFLIYSIDPKHISTGTEKNKIDNIKLKFEGDTGIGGNISYKKGIYICNTKCFGDEHTKTKKTSLLLIPLKNYGGYYWKANEYHPSWTSNMSTAGHIYWICTCNRKIIYVEIDYVPSLVTVASVIAHEFQHLIYFSHDKNHTSGSKWINEGLSVYAQDLNDYWAKDKYGEEHLKLFKEVYRDHRDLSSLRISKTVWVARNATDVKYGYAISGIWTLYLAHRFPKNIEEYGSAKGDHKTKVFEWSTISTDANDEYKNIFAEWALANYFNKIVVDIKKNLKPIIIKSLIPNFKTHVDAGRYNYYVQTKNEDIKDGAVELKIPNMQKIREMVIKIPAGNYFTDSQKERPNFGQPNNLDIKQSSIAYLEFAINFLPSDDKRLHIHVTDTQDIIKMYTIEECRDDKTCWVSETTPSSDPTTPKEILFDSHTNQKSLVAILPNHTTNDLRVKYRAYYTEKPKVQGMIFTQAGVSEKVVEAPNKTNTTLLENATEMTLIVVFDQEMMTDTDPDKGNYTFKQGETLENLAKDYYGDESKKNLIISKETPPTAGTVLEFPFKIFYVYEGETTENEFSSTTWSKTIYENDTLTVTCTPLAGKKARIFVCCAANFGKDIMLLEKGYTFKVKVITPKFSPKK